MSRMRIDRTDIKEADIFQILLDHFPDMIHSVDEAGNIVYTNKAAEKLLGYSHDELIGRNVKSIYADEIVRQMEAGFADLKKSGDKSVESILKHKDGTSIPVEIRSFSIYDDDGAFIRTFSILRDIRELKRLQQGLIHQGRLAAIGEFASGIAHDINNPLTVISITNELMVRELTKDAPDVFEKIPNLPVHLENIERGSDAIQKLVEHLRAYSRGMVEEHVKVDLHESLNDALFMADSRVKKHSVTVVNRVEPGECFVRGCQNQVEQIFMNLVTNACDAMEGCPERTLSIDISEVVRHEKDYWNITVSDTGKGIPSEIKEKIFDSFFTTKIRGKGTGLGLAIVKGIISDHSGTIEIDSQPNEGTTFNVYFPKFQD